MPNPAMGLRAIRWCLAEPQMFLTQLRAILRASHYGKVRILLPMLAHLHEIEQTLTLIRQAKQQLDERGEPYDRDIEVGGMIEIPAAALALPIFMRRLNFLSIGDRKSTRLNSSHLVISYAVFCLKKKTSTRTSFIRRRIRLARQ